MDYPQLNLIFGLILIFTIAVNSGLRVLLLKMNLPVGLSLLSWVALLLTLFAALYIEILFLRYMTPVFNRQIALGWLLIGGSVAWVTAGLYRRVNSSRLAGILFGLQILISFVSLLLACGLYRSLVPIP